MNNNKSIEVGNNIWPDGWNTFMSLEESEGFSDSSFPGCQFRLPSSRYLDVKFAVNITVTGKLRKQRGILAEKVKIEWVGDGEPSEFSGGILIR